MTRFFWLLAFPILARSFQVTDCPVDKIAEGGHRIATKFFAASQTRAHEVVADAMQAAGVLLFKDTERSVEGERADERIRTLGLPAGDEAIAATLDMATENGLSGVKVTIETKRRAGKKGEPKRNWSEPVLEHAACLLALLSPDDPSRRPAVSLADAETSEIRIPAGTQVHVRARRFLFNTDLRPNRTIIFETARDSSLLPPGLLVVAEVDHMSDVKEFGIGAKGYLTFKAVALPDATRLPLQGSVNLQGMTVSRGAIVATTIVFGLRGVAAAASARGRGFAVPAGTLFQVEITGDHTIRLSRH